MCSGKSEADVTNNRRLCSTYIVLLKLTTDRHGASVLRHVLYLLFSVHVAAVHNESLYQSFVESVFNLFMASSSDINDISLSARY